MVVMMVRKNQLNAQLNKNKKSAIKVNKKARLTFATTCCDGLQSLGFAHS